MEKRVIVWMMTVLMALAMIPAYVFADDTGLSGADTVSEGIVQTAECTEAAAGSEASYENSAASASDAESWKKWSNDGTAYYSTKDGKWYSSGNKLLKGIRTVDNKTYFFKDGKKSKGWKKVRGRKYYFKSDYAMAKGLQKIGKNYYFFSEKTGVAKGKGLFKSKSGRIYYSKGHGRLATGWTAVGKRAYYFYKGGKKRACSAARGTTIGHLRIPKKGYLGYAYVLGIRKLNKTKWTLKQAYKNSSTMRYFDHDYRRKTSEEYAIRGFKYNHGNCFVMAATFYIQAKLLGYDVHQVKGLVSGRFPHSWTVIKQNGKEWVYDPNFKQETGRNGYKIYYGKRGTWRYGSYKKIN